MASFMNKLRAMVGFKAKGEEKKKAVPKTDRVGAFQTLSTQFLTCEDDAFKAQLWEQMCKALPDTLFLAAMCYEGDDPNAPVRDRDLHATVGAKGLFAINQHIVTNGNPGYRLAKKADSRRIHLRTIVYNKTKEEWVPLFTDFTRLLPVFGQNFRVTVISFAEARRMAKDCKGLIINPGKDAIRLDNGEMKKAL
ncbi:MAG: SseB family protein [Clostridia bacterium]|nr:SseB family protein [Clostridia bacterium]